jgi:hypothetical protein
MATTFSPLPPLWHFRKANKTVERVRREEDDCGDCVEATEAASQASNGRKLLPSPPGGSCCSPAQSPRGMKITVGVGDCINRIRGLPSPPLELV